MPVDQNTEQIHHNAILPQLSILKPTDESTRSTASNSGLSDVSLVRSWYRRFRQYLPTRSRRSKATYASIRSAESTLGLLFVLTLISRRSSYGAPRLSEVIERVRVPCSQNLCWAARRRIRCPILRAALAPSLFGDSRRLPTKFVDELRSEGTAVRILGTSERLANPSLLGLIHQVSTGMVDTSFGRKDGGRLTAMSKQRQYGIYYTPECLFGKSIFCCVELQKSGIKVYLKLKYSRLENLPSFARDVSGVGHYGVGDLQLAISNLAQIEEATPLIRKFLEAQF